MLAQVLLCSLVVLNGTEMLASARLNLDTRYRVIDLGVLYSASDTFTLSNDINEAGIVVGNGKTAPHACAPYICYDTHGFVARDSGILDLGNHTGQGSSSANAIDDLSRVVGSSKVGDYGKNKAVLWESGVATVLPDYGVHAWAFAIDESGIIVGSATKPSGYERPVAWRNGAIFDLGTLPGGLEGQAVDVNRHGLIVGMSFDNLGVWQPVAWRGGRIHRLDILDQAAAWGRAMAVNDMGEAVGASYVKEAEAEGMIAVLWAGGTSQRLGFLNQLPSTAYDINDVGQVVGQSDCNCTSGGRAFLWEDGQMTDLNDRIDPQVGWTLYSARGITNDGRIAATGQSASGELRAVLLEPLD